MNLLYHTITLASASPQRQRLLQQYGFRFSVQPSGIIETLSPQLPPEKNAEKLAREKAHAVSLKQSNQRIILGADTIVVTPNGDILGKPKNKDHAKKMITKKRETTERVITGYCIISEGKEVFGSETSWITYKNFSQRQQESILDSHEWEGVSGGLRIEGEKTKQIIEKISGDYQNIIGLPLGKIAHILRDFPL